MVGQVNGLAVLDVGDHQFGRPTRITTSISAGLSGVLNIERLAALSGRHHDKGVLILTGYLRETFALERPLAMTASITLEQSYDEVDGDSAATAETLSLLSALSGVPARQDMAVTGSMNQKGQVQAVGGVNEKIEGFYDLCLARGLTGNQGAIIPAANKPKQRIDGMEVVAVDADDVYGMSKNGGDTPDNMVLRTSIIGEERGQSRSLLEWARSQAGKHVKAIGERYGLTCERVIQIAKEAGVIA
jgi:predicted ATP-dependent protease